MTRGKKPARMDLSCDLQTRGCAFGQRRCPEFLRTSKTVIWSRSIFHLRSMSIHMWNVPNRFNSRPSEPLASRDIENPKSRTGRSPSEMNFCWKTSVGLGNRFHWTYRCSFVPLVFVEACSKIPKGLPTSSHPRPENGRLRGMACVSA